MKPLQLLVVLMIAGCSAPPATPPARPATEAAEPAPASAPAPAASATDTAALADALIADMRAKEAAFAKLEKELPAVRATDISPVLSAPAAPSSPAAPPAPSAPGTPYTPPSVAAPPSAPVFSEPIYGGHNESWWKNEMHTIEARLESSLQRLKEVEKQVAIADEDAEKARYSTSDIFRAKEDAYHQAVNQRSRLKAAIESDRFAVERLREEARRANVPPGWLRWP